MAEGVERERGRERGGERERERGGERERERVCVVCVCVCDMDILTVRTALTRGSVEVGKHCVFLCVCVGGREGRERERERE